MFQEWTPAEWSVPDALNPLMRRTLKAAAGSQYLRHYSHFPSLIVTCVDVISPAESSYTMRFVFTTAGTFDAQTVLVSLEC